MDHLYSTFQLSILQNKFQQYSSYILLTTKIICISPVFGDVMSPTTTLPWHDNGQIHLFIQCILSIWRTCLPLCMCRTRDSLKWWKCIGVLNIYSVCTSQGTSNRIATIFPIVLSCSIYFPVLLPQANLERTLNVPNIIHK